MSSAIRTAIRLRPFLPSEIKQGYKNTRIEPGRDKQELLIRDENSKSFRFDYVFNEEASQEEVYSSCDINSMVEKALEGYHSAIFAYGQTGSGKTFTMQGSEDSIDPNGIIPKLVSNLYRKIQHSKSRTYTIYLSFLQIYNERIYDLLNPSSLNNRNVGAGNIEGLRLRWSKDEQFTVENMFVFECKNEEELMRYFVAGNKNRINASHKLNVQSSRSHSIMTIKVESFEHSNPSHVLTSKIELVDLAGSERLSVTGAEGRSAKESIDINKSLFTLRQVISILSEKKMEKQYVPYRDSKLTSLLKQSIGGSSYSLMIACVNPNDMFLEENISTLTYATKTAHITNRPVVNDDPRTKIVNELRLQVRQLNSQLQKANKHIEMISGLNSQSESPRKMTTQNQLPVPVFKKKLQQRLEGNYENVSERLIESINMVRELLKSNKELREKIEITNRLVDEKDIEIYELSRENDLLRERTPATKDTRPQLMSSQGRVTVKPPSRGPPPIFDHPLQGVHFIHHKQSLPHGYSVEMGNMYMTEKGIDSAPTNFNKREVTTSQEQRMVYSRGGQAERHAITAKIGKRGWLGKQSEPKRFLSFYEQP